MDFGSTVDWAIGFRCAGTGARLVNSLVHGRLTQRALIRAVGTRSISSAYDQYRGRLIGLRWIVEQSGLDPGQQAAFVLVQLMLPIRRASGGVLHCMGNGRL